MLDAKKRREIDAALEMLELESESNWGSYAKQAVLHVLRDHQGTGYAGQADQGYVMASDAPTDGEVGLYGNSDFLQAVSGKDSEAAWRVMDELMDTLHIVNAKVYSSYIEKIKKLR